MSRRLLGGVAALACAVGAMGSDVGMRIMLWGPGGLSSGSEVWVVLTQEDDCQAPVVQARTYARILGWPRATEIRHLMLEGSAVAVEWEAPYPSLELGRIRRQMVALSLRARGWSRTPLLVRTPARAIGISVIDLNHLPRTPR